MLLAPLVFIVARRTGVSLVKIGIPLLAGLSVVHGLVPPHPGPLLAIGAFGADIGKTIFYGLLVGLPTAIIAGPVYGAWIAKRVPGSVEHELAETLARDRGDRSEDMPGFGVTLFTILLPVAAILLIGATHRHAPDPVAAAVYARLAPIFSALPRQLEAQYAAIAAFQRDVR